LALPFIGRNGVPHTTQGLSCSRPIGAATRVATQQAIFAPFRHVSFRMASAAGFGFRFRGGRL
jgi:hypothetical protein